MKKRGSICSDWLLHLNKLVVGDLISPDFKLVSVKSSDKIIDVLKLLKKKDISCVPVFDDNVGGYVGLLDMLDIVSFIVGMCEAGGMEHILSRADIDWEQYTSNEFKTLSDIPVSAAIDSSQRNPWCPVWQGKPITSVMDIFSKDVNLHRIPIIDDNADVIGLVSQNTMIKFLAEKLKDFPHIGVRKLSDYINSDSSSVIAIDTSEKVMNAYKIMLEKKISGLAIVDEQRKLIGTISANDIKRSKMKEIFFDLFLPAFDFIQKTSFQYKRADSLHPICCTGNSTIEEVLQKFEKNHVHRLFYVNEKHIPMQVLSLCDVISLLGWPVVE